MEKSGWQISKNFDRTQALLNSKAPWYEDLLMTLWGVPILAYVIAVPVAVIWLFAKALF